MARSPRTVEPATPHLAPEENSRHGRLAFRPQPPVVRGTRTGLQTLDGRDSAPLGLVYVPPTVRDEPLRLVILLHGAGGSARQGIELLLPVADRQRLMLLAPKSTLATWDLIAEGYGPDVRRIDQLLDAVAASRPIRALTIGGFSDGASYALSLGIGNGDLFDSVVAFSPGFAAPLVPHGSPRIFVSHGLEDPVLPVDVCSRRIVGHLQRAGYDVTYAEFDGAHEVPADVVERAAAWLSGP